MDGAAEPDNILSFLTKGSLVEVSSDEDGLNGAWFVATVIHPPSISTAKSLHHIRNNLVYVEYHHLLSENGSSKRLREYADLSYVRPSPTDAAAPDFQHNDLVDAFYRDGWWTGLITRVVDRSNFFVTFQNPPEQVQFHISDLRVHRKWVDGRWVQPQKQGDAEGRTTGSLTAEQVEQKTPSLDKQSSIATSTMKRTKQTSLDGNDKQSRSSKKLKDGIMSDDPSLSTMASDLAPSKKTNDPPVGQSEGCGSEETVVNDQAFGKTENLSHGKKVRSKRGKGIELNTPTMDSLNKKGRVTTELRSSKALVEGATGDSVKERSQENVEKEHDTKDLPFPVVIGLKCNETTISRGKKLEQSSSERASDVAEGVNLASLVPVDTDVKRGEAEPVTPKRKRGRPPKLQPISPETSVAVNHQNEAGVSRMEGSQRKQVGPPVSSGAEPMKEGQLPVKEQLKLTGKQNTPKQKNTSSDVMDKDKVPNESSGQDFTLQRGTYSTVKGKRGKRRTISINKESPAQDYEDTSKEKADSTTRNPVSSVEDDQPLSRWFEGKQSPTSVHGTGKPLLTKFMFSLEESILMTLSAAAAAPEPPTQNPPFMRRSKLWETIESMEVFHKIPQKPHFRALEGVKESAREGLAIASMVTFTTVVEKTCGLRFEDPRSAIEDSLETLVELESHGFDVKVIRDRLTGLLLIKDKQEELEEQSKGVGDKIEEHKAQGNKIDKEIDEIDEQIRELQERRALALLKKERDISDIVGVKAAIEQEMKEVRLQFDGLAAAPW